MQIGICICICYQGPLVGVNMCVCVGGVFLKNQEHIDYGTLNIMHICVNAWNTTIAVQMLPGIITVRFT